MPPGAWLFLEEYCHLENTAFVTPVVKPGAQQVARHHQCLRWYIRFLEPVHNYQPEPECPLLHYPVEPPHGVRKAGEVHKENRSAYFDCWHPLWAFSWHSNLCTSCGHCPEIHCVSLWLEIRNFWVSSQTTSFTPYLGLSSFEGFLVLNGSSSKIFK